MSYDDAGIRCIMLGGVRSGVVRAARRLFDGIAFPPA
jgi:hypothetical protein